MYGSSGNQSRPMLVGGGGSAPSGVWIGFGSCVLECSALVSIVVGVDVVCDFLGEVDEADEVVCDVW